MIVLPGADLPAAASAAAFGSCMHQGQVCMTARRHIVHDVVCEGYVAALAEKARQLPVGSPHTGQMALGPVIDERQLKRIDSIVQNAVLNGAGGTTEGRFYQTTVLADLSTDNPAWTEEIFGPVAPS
jgi:benzaldehyde dehydrogenase (NAD)